MMTVYTSDSGIVTLENGGVAVTLSLKNNELPRIVYWGRALGDDQGTAQLYEALRPQRVSGGLDDTNFPTVLPTQAEGWTGAPRFVVTRDGHEIFCAFTVTSVETSEAAPVAAGTSALAEELAGVKGENRADAPRAASLTVTAEDAAQGVQLTWQMQVLEGGLVRQQARVQNTAEWDAAHEGSVLSVQTLELSYPVPATAREVLTTAGHHLRERHPQRQELTMGRFERVVEIGRPDFDATLLLNVGPRGFDFEHGEVYSTHVGWSGNSITSVEQTVYTLPLIGGGEHLYAGEAELIAGEGASYTSPWVYGSYGEGLNEVSQRFHSFVRSLHPNLATKPRPVILNTWEAVYFEHDFDTLKQLADKAAAAGVERFVVDDGWFGSRRDDTSGLGDWTVSQEVWPDGPKSLKALADYVHGLGMEFGLWFEPEMANIVSELNEQHPDWLLAPHAGRLPLQGRFQQVVDLSNPEACRYVFDAMDALVGELGIDYIKWDHNKLVTEPGSACHGYAATQHAQVEAVYAIFEGLKLKHEGLEIESCSSGGGRVDLGILERADRVWTSDCVDPVERAEIQRYTSLLVPEVMMGEHVGASPAHSTQRATSLTMRTAMALFGHFGIEWDLNHQPQEDLDELAQWVALYKQVRPWASQGVSVHGDIADDSVRLDGVVAADGSKALYRFAQVRTSVHYPALPVRLPGLDKDALYRVRPVDIQRELDVHHMNGQSDLLWWTEEGIEISGAALQNFGIRPPQLHPAQAVVFVVERIA
ncbi:alpha-galactosidase [Alloscardovia macacae]|nr:alpha-galactosidase [Alloscardovia macacae]